MIKTQTMVEFPEFADNGDKTKPDDVKYAAGFAESDVVPYEWFNWFLNKASDGVSTLNSGLLALEQEINNVLTAAGIEPAQATTNQVLTAINYLIQQKTGALDDLSTTDKTNLVAAVNEIKNGLGEAASHGVTSTPTEGSTDLMTAGGVNSSLTNSLKLNSNNIENDDFTLSQNSEHDFTADANGIYYITGTPTNASSISSRTFYIFLNDVQILTQGMSSTYSGNLPAVQIPLREGDKVTIKRTTSDDTYNFTNVFVKTYM